MFHLLRLSPNSYNGIGEPIQNHESGATYEFPTWVWGDENIEPSCMTFQEYEQRASSETEQLGLKMVPI